MCVIIDRKPGVTIPADMLDLACDINAHGWGIAWASKKKLHFEYSIKNPNDPKEVADMLQKLKDHRVFLHLRHATVGGIIEDNLHPFHVLVKKKHGIDLAMMHNGTLYDWKPKDDKEVLSDSYKFVEGFIRPLALRFNRWGGNNILPDQLFQRVVKSEVGGSSCVLLFDSLGNSYVVNPQQGKEYEGWWASNTYSFSPSHQRYSKREVPHYRSYGSNYGSGMSYETEADPFEDVPFAVRSDKKPADAWTTWQDDLRAYEKESQQKPVSVPDMTRKKYEFSRFGSLINEKVTKMQTGATIKDLK
ncbi:MAG TPA: class II glutamine amidotransferase, partial [Candidatus Paceibacterota bacterium]